MYVMVKTFVDAIHFQVPWFSKISDCILFALIKEKVCKDKSENLNEKVCREFDN